MKVFIVLAHPEYQSFNGAMYRLAVETLTARGHEVRTSDLYAMQFNPVSSRLNFISVKDPDYFKPQIEERYATETYGFADDVEIEIQKLEWCDLMIWQFPLWWFGLPGILKGWVDRVFAMGRTYGGERLYTNGVFKGKRAMLSLTTGGPPPAYVKGAFNGDIFAILRPVQRGMLQFVGFDVLAPQIAYGPVRLEQGQRTELLAAYAERLKSIESEQPFEVGIY
ncbi:NAD(P)H-dependent oxidoreductase [Bradyrhizobium sp.]|uniref:NAD(P)H-dependent oxidoreductase n=1 Tax=Bradyrhizobium sp. TaxID=376 RepID=UPI001DCC2D0A|nr:NAD(P)H-dependent oxidoreductase [Bradyrhizobium sp.]MBV8701576.1 NAD(P)H-dependent oxidoreductase [Bradyrhizobium sp.]MBV8920090.1 NAD(P)H-dependent oxidoreductase [Bradyrhizobium sp.]MBV9982955.1 NAD(P)H-dependent oxidoreductase [Bradyrhizobium sp.]